MNFAPLTLDDVPLVRRYFNAFGSRLCDYTVGGTVMWRDYFHTCFAEENGVLYFRTDDGAGGHIYSMPVTPDDAARQAGRQARETIPVPWPKILEQALARYERLIALNREGKLNRKYLRMI